MSSARKRLQKVAGFAALVASPTAALAQSKDLRKIGS